MNLKLKVDRRLGYNRTIRKLLHLTGGLPALLLPFIPYWLALAGALGALALSVYLKPRHAWWLRYISKPADRQRNVITGMRGYATAVLLLVILWPALEPYFPETVRYVMFGWLSLAFGDGLAGLLGPAPGEARTVPWNVHKTWWGMAGCFLGNALAFIICFLSPLPQAQPYGLLWGLIAGCLVCVGAAILESLDTPLDDNYVIGLGAPLLALLASVFAG